MQPHDACKTFAGAISKTATGGDLRPRSRRLRRDPDRKPITISGEGTQASILASAAPRHHRQHHGAGHCAQTDTVVLRNLQINGAAPLGIDGSAS